MVWFDQTTKTKKKKMTDASNDACSSGAVRSTASVSRLGLFQGVPEEADKAGCKVELAQNYRYYGPIIGIYAVSKTKPCGPSLDGSRCLTQVTRRPRRRRQPLVSGTFFFRCRLLPLFVNQPPP
ncbi:hypothetical protein MGG_15530 [Pyricularia oryzae 70-15]|uniref:Uncharacterized protein n=1 Tax=Pyricularia oryzae (strain 70-15 / ATCC MYA-4617 / FGSC 8958) TaxID=242507 RepID=G4MZB6_PYRO7|nr:uncharacterized protein MGG_15530 [Pyricularia oryzae 70-15]EHA53671.1 hypothetical protein MGG_15530 [Pyricularia oryzae 70-15]